MSLFRLEITTRQTMTIERDSYAEAEARAAELAVEMRAQHHHGEVTTIAVVDPNAKKESFYFGCADDDSGHYLWTEKWGRGDYYNNGTSWKQLDGYLLGNAKERDEITGRVLSTVGKKGDVWWWAFVWWDRSVDRRGGSNSGLYVRGFGPNERDAAFAYACEKWPTLIARQQCKLVLV